MEGRIIKLNNTCKLLVGIVGVNFFGDRENCEEIYRSFLIAILDFKFSPCSEYCVLSSE